ncbi:MAG TPA: HAMP domain-containing sensor histidine kinase [Terriglobales bacterium]|nr:HAMP domain-containing sensor histidine kinase [Terriglobales bacterium]
MQVPGDDAATANRCLRDVVALSTLPAIWLGAEMPRVAESLAAALFTTVSPDLVFVALRDPDTGREITVAQTDRYHTDEKLAAELARPLFAWAAAHDAEELAALACGPGMMHFAVRSLGYEAELGIIAAGYRDPESRTQFQSTLLGVGAAQAASQVRNCMLLRALRDAAAENARLVADLRAEDQRKNEFLATLAHELRNPLAPIRNGVEVLKRAGSDPQTMQQVVAMMDRQVTQMVRLVDDLLDVSRISRGKIELRRECIDIAAAVRSAIESNRPLLDKYGSELIVTLPPRSLWVDGDLVRLAQVLANLLNNATKYTPAGGTIRLTVAGEGAEAVVRVCDNGIGIAAEMLPRIFELFTQADDSIERSQSGLGIGLTIVQRLVEMHGGSITAHSDGPGRGSEFVVRLPLAAQVTTPPIPDHALA